jgi:phosphatidylserine/phosphatidylglycerophosphate/cardiolipin synthase-like enzyme
MLQPLRLPDRHRRSPPLQLLIALVVLWLAGCASLPANVQRSASQALQQTEDTRLGRSVAEHIARTGQRHASGFRLIGGTEAAYASRLSLIDAADKTLDLQYYAILADPSTGLLLQRLRDAAARGVRVRILLDDFNTTGANAQVLRLAFVPNIEVRLYNPLPGSRRSLVGRVLGSLGNIEQAQRRMHNKVFIADNTLGITGGRNLGDAYFGQGQDSNFIDLDVLAAGRIVRTMSASFDSYWNNELAYPVQALLTPDELDALKKPDDPLDQPDADPGAKPLDLSPARLTWAPSLLLADKADKIASEQEGQEDTVVDGLLRLMATTREDLFIVSPYFVPGEAMMEVFAKLRSAGVRVRVLTNSLAANDAPLAHVGYARYRKRLLEMGVELYELRAELGGGDSVLTGGSAGMARVASRGSESSTPRQPSATGSVGASRASLHAKTLVLDHSLLVVGSMNLDLRSQLQNSEIALLIRSGSLARQAEDMAKPVLEQDAYRMGLEDGRVVWYPPDGPPIRSRFEPDAGKGMQWLLKIIGPLAPDEML